MTARKTVWTQRCCEQNNGLTICEVMDCDGWLFVAQFIVNHNNKYTNEFAQLLSWHFCFLVFLVSSIFMRFKHLIFFFFLDFIVVCIDVYELYLRFNVFVLSIWSIWIWICTWCILLSLSLWSNWCWFVEYENIIFDRFEFSKCWTDIDTISIKCLFSMLIYSFVRLDLVVLESYHSWRK